ncbi:extracellular solute-binding protein [Streptomyces sp. NPDC047002]|uniref:ABC transporter substrate-binding protein n=1 Tax=Streptomyces sp. NPDC047002 TaxID=3155475 RepID=UPI003451418E
MRRRAFIGGLGAAAAGAALGACSDPDSASRGGDADFFIDAPTWGTGLRKAGERLRAVTGTGLAPQSIPTTSSYEQVIKSQLQTRNPPDLIKWGSGYRMQDLARTGTLAPLDAQWAKAEKRGWLDPALRSRFTYRGRIYGLPLQNGYYVMLYNKKLFARLGLSEPTTWDAFTHVLETLKRHGTTPLGTTQVNAWPAAIWFGELASKTDPDWYRRVTAGRASYTDAAPRRMMRMWQSMIRAGYHTSPDRSFDDFPALLKEGGIAMYAAAVSWTTQSLDAAGMRPTTDFGAFLLPTVSAGTERTVISEAAGITAAARASGRRQSLDLLDHWLDPDVQRPWSSFLWGSSANPTLPWQEPASRRIQREVAGGRLRVLNRYWEASPPALVEGNVQDLGGFMADPSDPDGVLESMQSRARTEWEYWKKETS